MMIVPELETVFILVPRTGTGTLYRELKRVYPKSMLLYRHMEADGCPQGYDRWKRVGFVRHPLARLWSLYNFMRDFSGGACVEHDEDKRRIWRQVSRPFEDWLTNNNEPWTVPYDLSAGSAYWPILSRRNPAPENRLSQFQYLRPDLGVGVQHFSDLRLKMESWGLNPEAKSNGTSAAIPNFSSDAWRHIEKYCPWDLAENCEVI